MNEIKNRELDENDEVIFYYKGIGVRSPSVAIAIGMEKTGHEMILDDLKDKMLEDVKTEYREQLDEYVQHFTAKFQGKAPNLKDIEIVVNQTLKLDMKTFFCIWSTTICALLKLKVINNDIDNGFAIVSRGTVDNLNRFIVTGAMNI
jgi:hypothetical protein